MAHELFSGIDPRVISALGLSEEIEQPFLKSMREAGKRKYEIEWEDSGIRALHQNKIEFSTIGWSTSFYAPRVLDVPVKLLQIWESESVQVDQKLRSIAGKGIRAFLRGFGDGALERKNWGDAVDIFDTITDGGILQNSDVLFKFEQETKKYISFGEPLEARRIAEIVDRKVKSGPKVSSSSS